MNLRQIFILIVGMSPLLCMAAGGGAAGPGAEPDVFSSNELRDAVMAQRALQREELRREAAWAGRRLTPSELFQLREQVRHQWPSRIATMAPAELGPVERVLPTAMRPTPGQPLSTRQP